MKKFIGIGIAVVAIAFAFLVGVQYGVKITAESAVIIEDSKYHYGISYLGSEIECYYTK